MTMILNKIFLSAVSLATITSASAFVPLPSSATSATAITTNFNSKQSQHTSLSASKTDREPWNFFRFMEQSSKFISILPQRPVSRSVGPGATLWDDAGQQAFSFAPLDDVVMGGASSSTFDNGRWAGTVTTANNGGFVGIRSTPSLDFDVTRCKGLKITIQGDSNDRRLKLGLRDTRDFNGIVWNQSFDVPGNNTQTVVDLPFSKLVPTKFAGIVGSAGTFQTSNLMGVQFVHSKFEYDGDLNPKFHAGDMDLKIQKIETY
uniref:NADH:ubiquinone oxidoreductase intermediate-associated protein 30 domain-containing protein n=1 Tax=Craspedostauros australis TaxID=1486917 RepID=A0A7R9WT96_9STRA|mmetsp:Transcript_18404/g.51094  ORF Transcript_18404/g.51094 Transcript_18404/m.51094 type:complete len:261 (+) Transcript_18404:232-1014(+)